MGSPISAVYAATKGAVQAWTRSAARAWAADNVTVNARAPAVQTPGAAARERGPMLVLLAGAGSGFITGQLIAVDGGLVMVGG